MQRKWLVYSAGKFGFLLLCKLFSMLMSPKSFDLSKIRAKFLKIVCFLWSNQWVWLIKRIPKSDWCFFTKNRFFDFQKSFMFYNSSELIFSNQLLQRICRGEFAAQKFLGTLGEIRAKYPSHPQKCACFHSSVASRRMTLFCMGYRQARKYGGAGGLSPSRKFFSPPGKMCWTYFKSIGHSLKNLGPSLKTPCNVHHSSLLVINMDVVRGHMSYAHAHPNKKHTSWYHLHPDQLQ